MKIFLALLLFIGGFLQSTAQSFELGKVSVAELQEKVHPKDSSAVAAILFEKGTNNFIYNQGKGFEVVLKVKVRVKIYKKEGYDWATKKVGYYSDRGSSERVSFSNAYTYNLINGKIEKTKLKSEGEFNDEINSFWSQKKITMPNVKEGSVIEYEYAIYSERISSLRDWYFQSSIPVNYSSYTNSVPEYFKYNSNSKGFIFPKVTVSQNNNSIIITSKERGDNGGLAYQSTSTTFSSDKIDFMEKVTEYVSVDVPAMKSEAYVYNLDNYTASLSQELTSTLYPNSVPKYYSTTWEDVVKTIYDYDDFGPELKKTGYFEEDITNILKGKVSDDEKIDAILNHVKTAVKWNDIFGYSCMNGVKKAYKEKTGNIADINLMLTAMLRYAGFTVNPVLVSTRSNGISFFPNRNAFNYVIAAVELNGKTILLDGSDPFSTQNILPFRVLNWGGRMINVDGTSSLVPLLPTGPSTSSMALIYSIDEKGEVQGECLDRKLDYYALKYRNDVKGIKEDTYLEKKENIHKISIKEYTRTINANFKEPVAERYSFSGNQFTEQIGGKMYINPLLFFVQNVNPFKQEVREYPVDFGFPFMDRYSVTIHIPEGYKVEQAPESYSVAMMDNMGKYNFFCNVVSNTIQISITHQVNDAIIPAVHYMMLKEFYQKTINKQNEKIVLSKI
ncbi:transglutaminase [Flavobacterium faecale]|uniref:Transglutaminase n=1 Tax=Flavobacterium faecale TaxID=1355330 RepID=A0A2S1LC22_9FLAO|nr:DUF3857 domain-containing protein [Flavobacterium faecale]AWG21292.1 transglutaminase [Flavobacterium faecale]